MKIHILSNNLLPVDGIISVGPYIATGNVYLTRDSVLENEVVSKAYVDSVTSTISVSSFTSGTIAAARLPAFSGQISKAAGSTSINLNVGATHGGGTFTKVFVGAHGYVTDRQALQVSDIPDLPWSKITSGKPTTLAGYGITGVLPKSGGTVTGNININQPVGDISYTSDLHAVTKTYVDDLAAGATGGAYSTGDIRYTAYATQPSGYLICNGADISKTTYADLYAVVGDTFSINAGAGAGQPWRQQYDFNTTQSTDITGWTTGTSLPATVFYSQAIVTKNRVYLLGGHTNSGHSSEVYTAPINADGTLGAWTIGTSLPATVYVGQAIVTKNRVYLLGGYVNGVASGVVLTALINADGTLGAWTIGTSLPATVYVGQAIVTKNRVYLLGGYVNDVQSSAVYTAAINTDGTLGTWTTGTPIPATVVHSHAIVTKNRVYLLGGLVNGANSSAVHTAPINTDGTLGAWTTGTSLPAVVNHSHAIVTKNRVYLLGGIVSGAQSSEVYTAPINTDGTLGTWALGTALPATVADSQAIVTKNRVYLLGGYVNSANSSAVYTASISGGLNDYSPYYDPASLTDTTTDFRLPDLSALAEQGLNSYIKT